MCTLFEHKLCSTLESTAVKFVTIRQLRASTASIRKDLAADEEIVVTANGRPVALLTPLDADNLEQELRASRRARAAAALDRIRAQARAGGTAALSMKQIDDLVTATRQQRQLRS